MPRLRLHVRDLETIEELEDLVELEPAEERMGGRERTERRGPASSQAFERRQEDRRRGREFARYQRRFGKQR